MTVFFKRLSLTGENLKFLDFFSLLRSFPGSLAGCLVCFLTIFFGLSSPANAREGLMEDSLLLTIVYQKVKNAIGDLNANWPKMQIDSRNKRVAVYKPDNNTIAVDQGVIEICRTFGDRTEDALAFVVGHEVTHFHQKHQWKESGFSPDFLITEDQLENNRENEKNADLYGAFIAHQAGYQTIQLVPALLEKIYAAYPILTSATQTYPSLDKRKSLASESCNIAHQLSEIYNLANYLAILGKYEGARSLYNYISQQIKFKELYYNLGVINLLSYYHIPSNVRMQYPLDLDTNNPILRDVVRQRNDILQEAVQNLAFATHYDSTYYDAFINLTIAYVWNKDFQKAENLIGQLNNLISDERQKVKLQLVSGNYYAAKGIEDQARKNYQLVLNNYKYPLLKSMASINLKQLDGQELDRETNILPIQTIEDQIDDLSFFRPVRDFDQILFIDENTSLSMKELKNSILFQIKFQRQGEILKLQTTQNNFTKTNKGIGIKSSLAKTMSTYSGENIYTTDHTSGFYQINPQRGLIFRYDANNIIEEWAIFMF